jgi:hypothetical protein
VIERIPNLDPEIFKLILGEGAQTRQGAENYRPKQFFDGSVVTERGGEGFFKKILGR